MQRPVRDELAAADGGSGATASGDWSVVTRDDGSKQWAYKGKPLYTWVKDQKAGRQDGRRFREQRVAYRQGVARDLAAGQAA